TSLPRTPAARNADRGSPDADSIRNCGWSAGSGSDLKERLSPAGGSDHRLGSRRASATRGLALQAWGRRGDAAGLEMLKPDPVLLRDGRLARRTIRTQRSGLVWLDPRARRAEPPPDQTRPATLGFRPLPGTPPPGRRVTRRPA